jgi:hypothetical protein
LKNPKTLTILAGIGFLFFYIIFQFRQMAQVNCLRTSIIPLIQVIEDYRQKNGILPISLSELPPEMIEKDMLLDDFGNYYSYESINGKFRISVAGSSTSFQSNEKENIFLNPISKWMEKHNYFSEMSSVCKGSCPWPFCKSFFF